MSNKSVIDDFLNTIKEQSTGNYEIFINNKVLNLTPLQFQQQKSLVTSGLDGLVGVLSFITILNKCIASCSSNNNLKITDRVPVTLHLRNLLSDRPIDVEGVKVNVRELIDNIEDYSDIESLDIDAGQYTVSLEVPTLTRENKFLTACIEEVKKLQDDGLGVNISTILEYEVPKFITKIQFGENSIIFDDISIKEKLKIVNNLPASVTSSISEFITKVSEYDEKLLTLNDVTVELDSSIFE